MRAWRWTPKWQPATLPKAPCLTATSSQRQRAAASMAETGDAALYDYLLTTTAIRERARRFFEAAERDRLAHFRLDLSRLPAVTDRVIAVTKASYPDLRAIPYHGRYRHFDAGDVPRLERFQQSLAGLSEDDKLRARTELVITSVLLDAGAGPAWAYREADGRSYARSEGLAVASYQWFLSGGFSSQGSASADAAGLLRITAE